MRLYSVVRRILCLCGLIAALVIFGACATPQTPNLLEPRGPAALEIAELWWFLFWAGISVFLVVLVLCTLAVVNGQRRGKSDEKFPAGTESFDVPAKGQPLPARPSFVLIAGGIIPAVILLFVLAAAVRATNILIPPPDDELLTIEVIGHQWWWEVRYPQHDLITANEIYMPVGEPVQFRVTSQDVIHSFWVPQLHGKIDMVDGKIHTIQLEAWEPGRFRGICAEFCGVQHTFMAFFLNVVSQEEFEVWLAGQQQNHPQPADEQQARGQIVYREARCDQCHMIRGHDRPAPSAGRTGPDLTHLGTRPWLAAATVANTPATLAQFLLDPHVIKPGVNMLPTPLEEDDLDALVAYLLAVDE